MLKRRHLTLLLVSYFALTIFSCNSNQPKQNQSVQEVTTSYVLSRGAIRLLSAYDSIVTKHACNYNNSGQYKMVDTMPIKCYLLSQYHVGNNPDTPITYGTQLDGDQTGFGTLWNDIGWDTWGNCKPSKIYYPVQNSTSGSIDAWIVPQKQYQEVVGKLKTIDSTRNSSDLFYYGLKPISPKDIQKIKNWDIERSDGFTASKVKVFYDSVFSAAGVTLSVVLTAKNGADSMVNCYLIVNNDVGTMRWKDRVTVGVHN